MITFARRASPTTGDAFDLDRSNRLLLRPLLDTLFRAAPLS